jgi:ACS family D-galactonate transporter-like MFS transporter
MEGAGCGNSEQEILKCEWGAAKAIELDAMKEGSAGKRAWWTATLLGVGVLVNYFDRVNLAVAQGAMQREWGVGNIGFGYLSSAYSWTYAAMQLPAGWLLDRFGVWAVGSVAALLWSVASFSGAAAPGLRSFFWSRLLLGVAEAPTFPGNAKAVAAWFPPEKRGLPTAIFDAGAKLGAGLGVVALGWLLVRHGWRWSFAATGAMSFAYFVVFAAFYRDKKQTGAAERIAAGSASAKSEDSRAERVGFGQLLRQRKVLGLALGFSGYGYSFYLFLTWLPSYLSQSLHMDVLHSAMATAIPWGFATASDLIVGGWLVDWLIGRGHDPTLVRRWIVCVGLAMGLGVLGATQTERPEIAVAWITVALTGLAASAPVGWQIPALIAPVGAEGRVAAVMNLANNVMAIAAPIVTGYLVARTHQFVWPFGVAAAMVGVGIFGYTAVLGRMERVEIAG